MVMFIIGFLVGVLLTIIVAFYIGKRIEDKQLKQAEKLMRTFYKEEEYEQFKTRYES